MKIFEWLAELKFRNPILYRVGLVNFILFVLVIIPFFLDDRLVAGINPWIKPMKFCLSVGIYCWTIGWILFDIQQKKWTHYLSLVIGITMVIEIFVILYQASRGVMSHYNFETPFDSILFGLMGIMIGINTISVVFIFVLLLKPIPHLNGLYLQTLRIAFVIFLLGSYIGSQMISNEGHNIGVPDGGPGLPFFNWSTIGGDLRIAHFMGLHSIQILPLLAHTIIKKSNLPSLTKRIIVTSSIIGFIIVISLLWSQALKGMPLFS